MASSFAVAFSAGDEAFLYDAGYNDFFALDAADLERYRHFAGSPGCLATSPGEGDGDAGPIPSLAGAASFVRPARSELEALISAGLGALVLCVSERCNLRCSYCTFGGGYRDMRGHSTRMMTWDTARLAIDYYLERAGRPTLGFFGGEPLLAFDLIVSAIRHVRSRAGTCDVNLTTNGTLLDAERASALAELGAQVVVSIDGGQEVHDRHRRYPGGAPTFRVVSANLEAAASRHPDWFGRCVRVQMTIAPPYDLRPYEDFCRSMRHLLRGARRFSAAFVNTHGSLRAAEAAAFQAQKDAEVRRLRRQYHDAHVARGRDGLTIEPALFDSMMYRIHKRPIFPAPSGDVPLNGTCIPGIRRLYVDVEGRFHVCERISGRFPIGSVADGLSLEAVDGLLRRYCELSRDACWQCYAARFCTLCYIHATAGPTLDAQEKQRKCEAMRREVVESFALYCSARLQNPAAFDYLDGYVMM